MDIKTRKLNELKAEVFAAAGHPIRLAIIELLANGEQCVCDITAHVGAQRSNVSRHLSVLTRAGIVTHRKAGLKMMYSLKARCILNFMKCIEGIIRTQARDTQMLLGGL